LQRGANFGIGQRCDRMDEMCSIKLDERIAEHQSLSLSESLAGEGECGKWRAGGSRNDKALHGNALVHPDESFVCEPGSQLRGLGSIHANEASFPPSHEIGEQSLPIVRVRGHDGTDHLASAESS
jgi:hypothetical protein